MCYFRGQAENRQLNELLHKCLLGGIIIGAQPLAVWSPALFGSSFMVTAHPCAMPGQGASRR